MASVTPEGRLVRTPERGSDTLLDYSSEVGAVDLMDDQLVTTIDRHHFHSPDEIEDVDLVLAETAAAAGARQVVLVRAEQSFSRREVAGLQRLGYRRPPVDKITHLKHARKMVKDLPFEPTL